MAGSNGKVELTFDFDNCTLEELEFIEDYVGKTIGQIILEIQAKATSARALRSLAYIVARRKNPKATIGDFAEVKFGDLDLGGGETDPTVAAPKEAEATTGS